MRPCEAVRENIKILLNYLKARGENFVCIGYGGEFPVYRGGIKFTGFVLQDCELSMRLWENSSFPKLRSLKGNSDRGIYFVSVESPMAHLDIFKDEISQVVKKKIVI